jgi:hypothetical protein
MICAYAVYKVQQGRAFGGSQRWIRRRINVECQGLLVSLRECYQRGTLVQVGSSWFLRYRDYRERNLKGKAKHRSKKVGSLELYPTRAKAEKAADYIRRLINEGRSAASCPAVTFKHLADSDFGRKPVRYDTNTDTSRDSDVRGQDLSYWNKWSGREDSNLRPPGPEPGALPG